MQKGDPASVPWYDDEKSYLEVLSMLPATERQNPITYDAFRRQIEAAEKHLQSQGLVTYRIPVDAIAVKAWCQANNQPPCRKSIATFVASELAIRLRKSSTN